ncbi:MAG: universal stress protein [Candidatus Nitrosopolaris sp.]
MTTEPKATEDRSEVRIRKTLVPVDGSEYSINVAKYAIKIAKYENAQLFCIHIITARIPLAIPVRYLQGTNPTLTLKIKLNIGLTK